MALMQLRVATWNLNARTRARPVPGWVGQELVDLQADLLVLTEHVPGGEKPFLAQVLHQGGSASVSVSEDRGAGDNRILIATREPHALGPIPQPDLDLVSAHANFLSVTFASGVIGVGFRMPDYSKTPGGYALLWDWLFDALAPYRGQDLILAGDLNADFIRPLDRRLRLAERFSEVGLRLVPIADGVSYRGRSGPGTRIDHVFVGGSLRGVSGTYSWEAIDREHPGCRGCSHGVPDHALTLVTVSESTSSD
jgi:hypothetical protein